MHDPANQYAILSDLVDDAVREAVDEAPTRAPRQRRPSLRKGADTLQSLLHVRREFIAEPWALAILVVHGFGEFLLGAREDENRHL